MTATRPEALARVAARVREEATRLTQVAAALREALDQFGPEPQDRMHIHWVGGLLHDFYTGLEKAFSEVSPELNGESFSSETWHRDLLHTMTLDLPGFRPRVIRPAPELLKQAGAMASHGAPAYEQASGDLAVVVAFSEEPGVMKRAGIPLPAARLGQQAVQ